MGVVLQQQQSTLVFGPLRPQALISLSVLSTQILFLQTKAVLRAMDNNIIVHNYFCTKQDFKYCPRVVMLNHQLMKYIHPLY